MSDFSEDSITLDRIPVRAASPSGPSPAAGLDPRLALIRDLQPQAVEYIRQHGFVFDKVGPLPDDASELDQWKVLAFSLYNDVVEASTAAEHIIEAAEDAPAAGLPSVDELAQIIRTVDGNHDLGAGALAEAILARLSRSGGEAR